MKKGDLLELDIEKYAFEGKGIAKINRDAAEEKNYVVFVSGAYPGDKVEAKLTKIKKNYSEAIISRLIKSSNYRVNTKCSYFGICGGCKQQDMDYPTQVMYKFEQVKETFERLGGFSNLNYEQIIPSDKVFYYRNKMEFSFAEKKWLTTEQINSGEAFDRDFALGLHIPNMFDKVLDIDECFLQSEVSNRILQFTKKFFKSKNISIYNSRDNKGYLRNLVIKQAHHTKDLMVNLVTFYEDDELMKTFSAELLKEVPEITTIINNINLRKALIAVGDYEKVYYGSKYIYDYIGKYKFRISANSFFQTNTDQAEKLYNTVVEFAELKKEDIVYDLYSGAGTISIYVSDLCKEVYALEAVSSSVNDAEDNLKINNINNVNFVQADLYKTFLPVVEQNNIPKPDVIITDPPRSGMHENTVNDIISLNPEKIVYVSCNPATQVRDLKLLTAAGYEIKKVRPVDMFPHTYHIENVVLLTK